MHRLRKKNFEKINFSTKILTTASNVQIGSTKNLMSVLKVLQKEVL